MKHPDKITLRVPAKLKSEILEYAHRHGTNVTQLTLDHWRALLESEHRQEAEQV